MRYLYPTLLDSTMPSGTVAGAPHHLQYLPRDRQRVPLFSPYRMCYGVALYFLQRVLCTLSLCMVAAFTPATRTPRGSRCTLPADMPHDIVLPPPLPHLPVPGGAACRAATAAFCAVWRIEPWWTGSFPRLSLPPTTTAPTSSNPHLNPLHAHPTHAHLYTGKEKEKEGLCSV